MPSLKDAAQLTERLQGLTAELHSELTEGEVDYERMSDLADHISEHADGLAGAFNTVNDALTQRITEVRDGSQRSGGNGESGDESERSESKSGGRRKRNGS